MNQYKQCALLALSFLLVSAMPAFAAEESSVLNADKTAISAGDTAASGVTETEEQEATETDAKKEAEADKAEADKEEDLKSTQSEQAVEKPLKPGEESALQKATQNPTASQQPVTGQNKEPISPAAPAQPTDEKTDPEAKPLRGEAAPAVDPAGSSPNVNKLFSMFHAENQEKQADATTVAQPAATEKN